MPLKIQGGVLLPCIKHGRHLNKVLGSREGDGAKPVITGESWRWMGQGPGLGRREGSDEEHTWRDEPRIGEGPSFHSLVLGGGGTCEPG